MIPLNNSAGSCTICFDGPDVTQGHDDEGNPTYLGKGVEVVCCNAYSHEYCLLRYLNTLNNTPADYRNFSNTLVRDLRHQGLSESVLVRSDATENATKYENCTICREKITGFKSNNKEQPIENLEQHFNEEKMKLQLEQITEDLGHTQLNKSLQFKGRVVCAKNKTLPPIQDLFPRRQCNK